jgi:hypothetical protein
MNREEQHRIESNLCAGFLFISEAGAAAKKALFGAPSEVPAARDKCLGGLQCAMAHFDAAFNTRIKEESPAAEPAADSQITEEGA